MSQGAREPGDRPPARDRRPRAGKRGDGSARSAGDGANASWAAISRRDAEPEATGSELKMTRPGDRSESEADAAGHTIAGGRGAASAPATPPVGSLAVPERVQSGVERLAGAGKPLDAQSRALMQPSFGSDLDAVRVHRGPQPEDLARSVEARAFSVGSDVFLGAGLDAGTPGSAYVLAHEVAHAVQARRESGHAGRTQAPAPLQRTLTATGEASDFAVFANQVIAVQHEVVIGPGGAVSLRSTNVAGPLTPEAQELVRVLRMVIGDTADTSSEFIHGRTSTRASDARVLGGSFPQSKVDLDDEIARGTQEGVGLGMGVTGGALLVHEILEQYRKQVHGEDFATAHAAALAAEGTAIGAPRGASTSRRIDDTTVETTTTYTYPGGRVVEVIWDVVGNNIQNVRRRVVRAGGTP
jgi:hypothetical protein